jgi:hypothetical protein
MENLELTFTANIAESYKRLSYKLWYALSEFVDNSTQAYENHLTEVNSALKKEGNKLFVDILYHRGNNLSEDYFKIEDNSIGMDESVLRRAFNAGQKPENDKGRSKYGLGMKTASFWLGDTWSVETSMLGVDKKYIIKVNIADINGGSIKLDIKQEDVEPEKHFTIIKIENLHKRFVGQTIGKVKSYLSSIYRYDIMSNEIEIYWNSEPLEWIPIDDQLMQNFEGETVKKEFDFDVNGKSVKGWGGVLEKGGRGKAGFALVQNKRVINPNYRPGLIFGDQEGGRNDLVNQRLVGELFIDDFDVSHTKDQILWTGEEEEIVEEILVEELSEIKRVASTRRVKNIESSLGTSDVLIGFEEISSELQTSEALDILETIEIPPEEALADSNKYLLEAVVKRISEPVIIRLNDLIVKLYTDEDLSPTDPYILADSSREIEDRKTLIILVFNPNHPHWKDIESKNKENGVAIFIRQVVYDGVAEWKAYQKTGKLNHDTVKFIKDNLLRIPFEIEKAKS